VFVASGDVNGDGFADIVTGSDAGAGPHVKVFNGQTGSELHSFLAYDVSFQGGVRVAAGDVNGDGFADIITGAGAGGFGAVKMFDGQTGDLIDSFLTMPGASGDSDGIYVAYAAPIPEPASAALLLPLAALRHRR
jgi:hypothetical protein